jgi:hypothetical protein
MKFKVDENLPIEVGEILTEAGHDADTVADEALIGASDPKLAEVASNEERAWSRWTWTLPTFEYTRLTNILGSSSFASNTKIGHTFSRFVADS